VSAPADLHIRPFEPGDQAAVVRIFIEWNRAIAPEDQEAAYDAYIERSLAEEILRIPEYYQARPGNGFWIGNLGGTVACMVGIEKLSGEAAEVRRMYVDAPFRRRGLGSLLLAHAEAFSAAQGYQWIELSTSELQQAAKGLYERKGYRLVRTEIAEAQSRRTVGGGIRRFHYEKLLATPA